MVTTAQEYFANLDILQNVNQPAYALLPSAENIYYIDADTRVIDAPKFLSIEKDHKSETIYFAIDRYVDYMDLTQTCCVIQYNSANSKQGTRFYPVPFYDVYKLAHLDKIVFPWSLDANVTNTAGQVEFSIRFFKIDSILTERNDVVKELVYNLNTLPATSQILHGFNEKDITTENYRLDESQYDYLIGEIAKINYLQKMYWTILDDSFVEPIIDNTEVKESLTDVIENGREI